MVVICACDSYNHHQLSTTTVNGQGAEKNTADRDRLHFTLSLENWGGEDTLPHTCGSFRKRSSGYKQVQYKHMHQPQLVIYVYCLMAKIPAKILHVGAVSEHT